MWRLFRQAEAVADPGFGYQKTRLGAIRLNLPAQSVDENSEVFHFVAIIRPPNSMQKFAMCNGSVWMRDEVGKQVELLRREAHVSTWTRDAPRREVDFNILELDSL